MSQTAVYEQVHQSNVHLRQKVGHRMNQCNPVWTETNQMFENRELVVRKTAHDLVGYNAYGFGILQFSQGNLCRFYPVHREIHIDLQRTSTYLS